MHKYYIVGDNHQQQKKNKQSVNIFLVRTAQILFQMQLILVWIWMIKSNQLTCKILLATVKPESEGQLQGKRERTKEEGLDYTTIPLRLYSNQRVYSNEYNMLF